MAWRLAKSLDTLRNQVNKAYPNRHKSSDGTIGDEAHAVRSSDHNPWVKDGSMGVVTAIDFTHDPVNSLDAHKLAQSIVDSEDPRIKYVISNKRICSSTQSPWTWRKYSGSNPHTKHMHLSVKADKKFYDDEAPWSVEFPEVKAPVTPSKAPIVIARTVGGTVAAGAAVGQIASEVVGPSATTVETVKEVVNTSGQVVEVTKNAVKVVPESIWSQIFAFIQTPRFLAPALVVVCLTWLFTFLLRNRREAASA